MTALPQAVVLFGASGFIGRNIVDALKGRVETLLGVSRTGRSIPGCHAVFPMDHLSTIPALPRDTAVIDVAAHRYDASKFERDQREILNCNVAITNTVYDFCVERSIKEVRLASSSAVYPAAWTVLDDALPLDLNKWPHAGEAAYAWSKRWAEISAELHRRRAGVNTITFRLTNPYGPYDSIDVVAAHVAAAFVLKALAPGDSFEILGNPDAERDFVFVGDIAATFRASLERREESGVYNIAFGRATTIRDLAATALKVAGKEKHVVTKSGASSSVNARRVTAMKLRKAFELPPFVGLEQGLAVTMRWYRDVAGS